MNDENKNQLVTLEQPVQVKLASSDDFLAMLNSNYRRVDEIMSKAKVATSEDAFKTKRTYITVNSSKQSFNIDTSGLMPSPSCLLSMDGSFNKNYYKELEAAMSDDSTPVNSARFIEVCNLYNHVKTSGKPVNITSAKLVRKLPAIAQVLNEFFNDNAKDIDAITTMVYNKKQQEVTDADKQ